MAKKGKIITSTSTKRWSKKGKNQVVIESTERDIPDETSPSFFHDEIDEFHLQREKIFLNDEDRDVSPDPYRQEEVLGLESSSEDDENDDVNLDDDKDDDIPDARAWGKRKATYYNNDYSDKRRHDYTESEAAEAEEEEAKALEKRLMENMKETDFGLEWLEERKPEKKKMEEKVEIDFDSMSKEEKLEHIERTCPELLEFREGFIKKVTEAHERLLPHIKLMREKKIPTTGPFAEFILTKYQLIMQYGTNISFYFMLRAKGLDATNHPVVKRVRQFKALIDKLDAFGSVRPPERQNESHEDEKQPTGVDFELTTQEPARKNDESCEDVEQPTEEDFEMIEDEIESNRAEEEQELKRGITYEMAKNKGLTPYRKKENRNPRVKHRKKFERAKVRRKGQVREVVGKEQPYGGEHSGIRIGLVKGIKFK